MLLWIEMQLCGLLLWPCDISGWCSIIAATTEAPSRQTNRRGRPSSGPKALKRADSNAPFALQCQWFLSNLVA
jgi:hypothetical protein